MVKEKLIIYTGSFCPPTKAHFRILEESMKQLNTTKACFLPTCDSNIKKKMYGKMDRLSLKSDIRIKMLNTFADKHPGVSVSDYEVKKDDSDNTYETFCYLQNQHPDSELYYIIGDDKLKNLPNWKNIDKFLSEFNVLVFGRENSDPEKIIDSKELFSNHKDHFIICPPIEDLQDVSSSEVRRKFLNNDMSYRDSLTDEVADILSEIDLNDYPEIDVYDYIGFELKQGPFHVYKALKKVYSLNNEICNKIDLSDQLKNTEIIDGDISCDISKKYKTNIILENLPYHELVDKYDKSLIISEASKNRAAGHYDGGKNDTLEEKLCLISTLSKSLYKYGNPRLKCVKQSGVFEKNIYPFTGMIHVPGVKIIRCDDKNNYKELTKEQSLNANILLVTSLDCINNDKDEDLKYVNNDSLTNDGIKIMKDRLTKAFKFAYSKGYKNIIVNCFGNGFYVPIKDSAAILSSVINEFNGCFENIIINEKQGRKMKNSFYPNLTFERDGEI